MTIRCRLLGFIRLVLPVVAAVVALVIAEVGQTRALHQEPTPVASNVETLSVLQPDAPAVPCDQFIEYGSMVGDSIQAPGGSCHYTFHGRAGEHVTIRMVSEDLAPHVTLLDPTGGQVAAGGGPSGSSSSMIYAYRLTQTGLHTIVAQARVGSSQAIGDFTLMVARPGCGGNLGSGGVAFGETMGSSTTCRYTFEGLRGNYLDVALERLDSGPPPLLELYGPDGMNLSTDDEFEDTHRLPASGVYTVIVRAQRREQLGPFQLTLRQTPSTYYVRTTCGSPIAYGQRLQGYITERGEICQYTFSRQGDGIVTILMERAEKGTLVPSIRLIAPGGQVERPLTVFNGSDRSLIRGHRLQRNGQYTIEAGAYRGETTGYFTLAITKGRFALGETVRNVYTASNETVNLRRVPGYRGKPASDVLAKMPPGAVLAILGQPAQVDGLTWWPVSYTTTSNRKYTGWVAERTTSGELILGSDR